MSTTLSLADEVMHIWGEFYLKECAKLAETRPDLDDEELEDIADKRATEYFYLREKELLPTYWATYAWRVDLR